MEESRASLPNSPVVLASLVSIDRACLTSVSGLLLPLLLQYSLRMPRQIVRSCLPTLFGCLHLLYVRPEVSLLPLVVNLADDRAFLVFKF